MTDPDAAYWHQLETLVYSLATQALDEPYRLRPRRISSLGVSGTFGVPFLQAASPQVLRDAIMLLERATHDLGEVFPGLYGWTEENGLGLVHMALADIPVIGRDAA